MALRKMLALLLVSALAAAGLAIAATTASAWTIEIKDKLGPIRSEIIISKNVAKEKVATLSTSGNTFRELEKNGAKCHSAGAQDGEVKPNRRPSKLAT